MAIEISSKTKIKSSAWTIILGILCLILLLALVASYFYLDNLTKKIKQEVENKEKALVATSSEKELEDNLGLAERKINKFADLLLNHRNPLNVFTFLESLCLPNVQFSNFDLDSGKNTVSISGKTDNFITLEQQIEVFKKESLVEKIELSDISMGGEEGVNFAFLFTFNLKIFNSTEISNLF